MADRPILFSGPMVSALLAGSKTQTRRVLNRARVFATPDQPAFTLAGDDLSRALQNADRFRRLDGNGWFWEADAFPWQAPSRRTGWMAHIGYAPGDRLYVREAHHRTNDSTGSHLVGYDFAEGPVPREDRHHVEGVGDVQFFRHSLGGWGGRLSRNYPAMHMPKWASRLTLIVTDVRVQRLQDCSEADAKAEGIIKVGRFFGVADADWDAASILSRVDAYANLWDSLIADRGFSWDANPWVTATTFEVIKQNIDQITEVAA